MTAETMTVYFIKPNAQGELMVFEKACTEHEVKNGFTTKFASGSDCFIPVWQMYDSAKEAQKQIGEFE